MKRRRTFHAWCGLILMASCWASPTHAVGFVLEWDPVTDARITGYTVYYGEGHRDYTQSVNVGNTTTHTFSGLSSNSIYYFAVKANDAVGGESDFSNEVTSGTFRYVFGMSSGSDNRGELEVVNLNQGFEQQVPIGWARYNTLGGESRVATGDLDGDGKDEVVVGFGPVSEIGMAGGWFEVLDHDFSHVIWGHVEWPDYNAANGETRPAVGDIDGDGKAEIIIGLGRGGDGKMAMFRYADRALSPVGWADVNWPEYGLANGETWPALGDIDGDGRDELVIGLGAGGAGAFFAKSGFDSALLATGMDPFAAESEGNLSWAEYAAAMGETRPAVGSLKGDGLRQIVIGLGKTGAGNLEIFDFSLSSLIYFSAVGVDWPEYNAANGETRPAIGDIDGDMRGEIMVGFGAGGGGYVDRFDDATNQFIALGSLQVGSAAYQAANGASSPAVKRERFSAPSAVVYLLSVTTGGTGTGTVGGGGSYAAGTTVAPTATPGAGSTVAGWTPSSCGAPFPLGADTQCQAIFTPLPTYALTVSRSGSGAVASVPAGITCGTDCTQAYVSGTSVALAATPVVGYSFSGWSGACVGTGACTVSMNAAKGVTATFKALPKYTLTVKLSGSGTVTSTSVGIACGSACKVSLVSATPVALAPTPATGYVFSRWAGGCTGAGACNLTMSANTTVTAYFVRK